MIRSQKLQAIIDECDMHAKRLENAYLKLLPEFPMDEKRFASLSDDHISYLDHLIYRFTKLQDAMGAKLFPMLAESLRQTEGHLTFIDILNLLEKSEILFSARLWREMREFRNHLTHEYPDNPELMVKNLNAAPAYVKNLLECWTQVRPKAVHIQEQLLD